MENLNELRVQGQENETEIRNPNEKPIKMYYEYTKDYFRKGEHPNLIVHKFAKVKSVKRMENSIFMEIEGETFHNTQVDSDGELRPVIDKNSFKKFDAWLNIDILKGNVFRITGGLGCEKKEHETVMTEGVEMPEKEVFEFSENAEEIIAFNGSYTLCVEKNPFNLYLKNSEGKTVYSQANDDHVLIFTHESFPFGFVENPQLNKKAVVCSSRMEHDEHFFGFGEQYSKVDKTMQEVDVFITDPLSVGSPRTYLSLPFYWSTKGYGIYVNTHYRSKFFMGNRSNRSVSFHVYDEEIIDIFLIAGEQPKEILSSYTDVTGRPPALPDWSYGLWMSRCSYKTQDEVLEIAKTLREKNIPCDVINIDTDWFEYPWACDWKFGKHNFPNPKEMFQQLSDMNIKVSLWQKPYISCEQLPELTSFLLEKGWLVLGKDGEMVRENPPIDLTIPECYEWFKEQLRELFRLGAKVIKTDMGEGIPPEGVYKEYSGEEMHNIYAYLYNKAAHEVTLEFQDEGLLWARSGYAGSQKFPIHWAGDPFSDYDGLRYSIRSGLSMGMSGFTYWSQDIGGFLGKPDARLYVRWAQAGFFLSHSRCHGNKDPREPWAFGEEAERIFVEYDRLRYRLLPYIKSTGYNLGKQGLPVMAHLLLEYPEDRNCLYVEDQWMFGDAFMVAPVLDETDKRELYLPNGKWYDYFSSKTIDGGEYVNVDAPLDKLPLYVRAGSIIPMADAADSVEDMKEDITIRIYKKDNGISEFVYYDGAESAIKAQFNKNNVVVTFDKMEIVKCIEVVSEKGMFALNNPDAKRVEIEV